MGSPSTPAAPQNAAVQYAPAQIATQAAETAALGRAAATRPVTANYDVNKANEMANSLGTYAQANNLNNLKTLSPTAYTGLMRGISTISGGTQGDDQFLRNELTKSGLEQTNPSGIMVSGPGSAGSANVANIEGRGLLNYEQQRAGQQVALANGLMPDTSVSPGAGVSAYMGNDARFANNQNSYQQFLDNLSFVGPQNDQNSLNQSMSASQAAFNAQAQSDAAAAGANRGMLGNVLGGVGTIAGGVVGGIYGGPAGAGLGATLGGAAGKLGGTAISG